MKAMEERGLDDIFQLLEEENKVFTKASSQIFWISLNILDWHFKVVRRKALETLIKSVEEQDSWLEGDEEKLKAAGLRSLDDKYLR